jgi:hypothetical protein
LDTPTALKTNYNSYRAYLYFNDSSRHCGLFSGTKLVFICDQTKAYSIAHQLELFLLVQYLFVGLLQHSIGYNDDTELKT